MKKPSTAIQIDLVKKLKQLKIPGDKLMIICGRLLNIFFLNPGKHICFMVIKFNYKKYKKNMLKIMLINQLRSTVGLLK